MHRYSLSGLHGSPGSDIMAEITAFVTHFVHEKAVSGSRNCLQFPDDVCTKPSLQLMQASGFLENAIGDDGNVDSELFRLSQSAMKCLISGHKLQNPCRVFGPRDTVPVDDKTEFELMLLLKDAGWVWPVAFERILPPTAWDSRRVHAGHGSSVVY